MKKTKKMFFNRILALLMALAMILTGIPATGMPTGTITAEAAATSVAEQNNLTESIQDGAILHCWCWSFDTIRQNMADIAAAGFTTVQTSPANTCNATHTNMKIMGSDTVNGTDGCWWWHYQPTDWKIGNYQLGTRDDFKAMCQEADKYGIKVIVDVIPNHTTPDLKEISQDFINAVGGMDNLFHANGFNEISRWGDRYECTTGQMGGLPDVNTENPDFQYYFLQYLNDLIECGADGFRYDTAKHIGVPSDPTDAKSSRNNFWPVATGMESVKGLTLKDKDRIFTYGEVLQGDNVPESEYAQYMRMTASNYGGKLRSAVQSKNFSTGNISNWEHATPTHLVTWVESHDTYCNAGESVGLSKTQIRLAWAVIAARKDGTPLFYSRPNNSNSWANRWGDNVLGAKGDDEFKSKEVAAVNFFRNAMAGKSEYLRNPNGSSQILQIDRGTEGTCIINLGGSTTLNSVATSMADGTYTDQVSGRTFTVSGGRLSGQLDGEKVAVIYNPSASGVSATSTSGSEKFSSASLDVKLSAKNVTNATYATSEGASGSFTDGTVITVGETLNEGESVTVTLRAQGESGVIEKTFTFTKVGKNVAYIELPSGWSEPYCYAYNEAGAVNAVWPGAKMEKVSGNTYRYEVPDSVADPLVIFYGGDNSRRYPADMEDGLSLEGSMIYKNGTWNKYEGTITPTPTVTVTPTPTDIPGDGNVAYIELPSGWNEPYCYAYNEAATKAENAVWPGVKMEKVSGNLYKYKVPDSIPNPQIIFFGGDNSRRYPADMQPGLALSGSMIYQNGTWGPYGATPTITPTPTQDPLEELVDGSYDVYIKKPSGWGTNLNCYAYVSETLNNGVWPGVSMVSLGSGIYAYNMPEGWTSASVIFNDGGSQIPGAQQPGLDWTDGTSMIYKDGSWVKVEPKKKLDIVSSLADGSTFDTESETITLTLKNAVSGTYCVDDGPVKDFTDSAEVVIGQGKIADSDVKVKVTATDGTETKEVTFTYHKKFDAQKNGGYTQYDTSANAAVVKMASAVKAVGTRAASSESLGGKYATNPNSQKGKYKTINSAADFDESMIIAQGVANDDARAFRGTHEGPVYDTYALYGAWDDTNLYLGWQFVNVTDVVDPAQGYPISDNGKPWNGDIPQVLALNLGTGVTSDGSAKGTDAQTGTVNYSDYVWGLPIKYDTDVDALLCFSSKPGVGQPALFRADTDGYFNYDTAVGFKEGGISFKYEDGFFGSSLYGIKANGYEGYTPADLTNASANWTDFLTTNHSKAQDTFYVMTIPLNTLGVSRSDIENNGIGVMHISTFGMSGTACIPMDMTMLDHATDPYSHDDSTTAEKEDEDRITVPLARLGAGGSDPIPTVVPTPIPTIEPTPTPVVSRGTMTVNFGADRSSPQATTTALTLKAIAAGGNGTYTYQFLVDGKEVQNSDKDTYTWSPRSGEHTIGVKVTDGNGVVTECSKTYVGEGEDPSKPIIVNSFTANQQSPQPAGTSVKLTVDAEGGIGELEYRFYRVINGKTTVFRDYAAQNWTNCKPAAGTYEIYVDVKDAAGNIETAQLNYTWGSETTPIVINSFAADKQSPQPKGTAVKLSVEAAGGTGELQYRFYRVINGKTTVFRDYSAQNMTNCNPAAGTYVLYVDVKDAAGNIATAEMNYTWGSAAQELSLKSFTASKVSPQPKGTAVKFTAEAAGGTGELQYRFYRVINGKTTVFRDYAAQNWANCNPAVGTYAIYVDVKDASGNVVTGKLDYTWGTEQRNEDIVIKSFAASKVSPQPKGTSVTLSVEAEGGTGELQYRFYRVGNGKTTVFRDYSTKSSANCNPAAGAYIIYVDVKDSNGNIETTSMLYEWN